MEIATSLLLLTGIAGASLLGSLLYKKRQGRLLPTIDEDTFLMRVRSQHPDAPASVLQHRERLAKILSIPVEKLDPSLTVGQLIRSLDYLGDVRLGLSDLEDELEESLGERLDLREEDQLTSLLVALDMAARAGDPF